jgi:hypothetical protein
MRPVPVFSMIAAIAISLFATALPAAADFTAITSRAQFEQLVQGRELRRFGIRLVVSPNGQIVGRAFGGEVTGAWDWNDGYFCRDLFYQGDDLGSIASWCSNAGTRCGSRPIGARASMRT